MATFKISDLSDLEHRIVALEQAMLYNSKAERPPESSTSDVKTAPIDPQQRLEKLIKQVSTLYDAVAHGDYEHRKWLRDKIAEHFTGVK
jgi:hypothetical protein